MDLGNAPSGTKIISWAVPNLSTTQVITSVTTRYYSKDGGNALKVILILLTIEVFYGPWTGGGGGGV
jgi:hypothetical protein